MLSTEGSATDLGFLKSPEYKVRIQIWLEIICPALITPLQIYTIICDQVCKNQPCQCTKIATFFQLCCVITHVLVHEIYTTHAEIHGESFKAYRMRISLQEQEILLNI